MSLYFTFALTLFMITSVQAGRVMVTLFALKLGAQPVTVGVIAAIFSVMPMLLSWQIGRFSDRFGSRWLLLIGSAGGAFGMLLPYLIPALPSLYVAAFMNGLLFAFSGPPLQNLVGLQSPSQDHSKTFSNYSLLISCTSFLGPLLAGFSFDHVGARFACLGLALLLLMPLIMTGLWGGILPRGARSTATAGGLRAMLSESGLWRVLAISSLLITGIDLFQIYMPIYGYSVGLSASAIGVVLAMFSVASFVVRTVLPRLIARLTVERVLAYSFLIGAAAFTLVPFLKNASTLALVAFLFGLGMGCGQPITMMLTFSCSAKGRSGEGMGLRTTVNHFTRVIAPLVFGSMGSAFGMLPVFWVNALILASGGAFAAPSRFGRRVDGSKGGCS